MARILRNLPFLEEPTTVRVLGDTVLVKPYQIIVWVSVAHKGQEALPPNAVRFPAILDTGHSHNFSISERHLAQWAGLSSQLLPHLRRVRIQGREVPLLAANVWLHRNRPGRRDEWAGRPPFRLELHAGIAVHPTVAPDTPRLPLLGLRALRVAGLRLVVNGRSCRVSLGPPGWLDFLC